MKRPRLKQMPMFLSPELERTVRGLPAREHDIACELHRLVIDDDRTWLDVVAGAAADIGTTIEEVLSGDRHARPARARRRAWWEIREGTNRRASLTLIGDAFRVHHTTVLAGVEKYSSEIAEEQAAIAAVERHNAEAPAA